MSMPFVEQGPELAISAPLFAPRSVLTDAMKSGPLFSNGMQPSSDSQGYSAGSLYYYYAGGSYYRVQVASPSLPEQTPIQQAFSLRVPASVQGSVHVSPNYLGRDPEIDVTAYTSAWFRDALEELSRLAAMPPNWDGYGSRPIQRVAYANMVRVLAKLANAAPKPQIFPISGGALQTEWSVEGRDLEIVTRSDGSITCLTMDGDDEDSIEVDVYDIADSPAILAKVSWLMGTRGARAAAA